MHVVIMGCGRVGAALAITLIGRDHSVAVIDRDPAAFRRLGTDFPGQTVEGMGFDRDTLRRAGVTQAGALAAVSSGDNSNILTARVARETFGVANVVARIYDPRRAVIYERLGIPTVASVAWTTDQVLRRLLPLGASEQWRDPSGGFVLAEVHLNPQWVGQRVGELAETAGARIALLSRFGQGLLPDRDTIVQENDLVYALFPAGAAADVAAAFDRGPGGEDADAPSREDGR